MLWLEEGAKHIKGNLAVATQTKAAKAFSEMHLSIITSLSQIRSKAAQKSNIERSDLPWIFQFQTVFWCNGSRVEQLWSCANVFFGVVSNTPTLCYKSSKYLIDVHPRFSNYQKIVYQNYLSCPKNAFLLVKQFKIKVKIKREVVKCKNCFFSTQKISLVFDDKKHDFSCTFGACRRTLIQLPPKMSKSSQKVKIRT